MLEELLLDELPAFILPVAVPVVVPFFMFVCLVVLLVAPWPALLLMRSKWNRLTCHKQDRDR